MFQAHSPEWRRITLALCLGAFMIFSNLYVVQPLLPDLAAEFGKSELESSYAFTISTLFMAISLLVFGPLSDALGRKPLMMLSMLGVLLSTFALSQADSYESLVMLRAVQGFLLGGLPAIAIAYMADEFDANGLMAAVGLYIAANSLGGISGRVLGGFAGHYWGWPEAFLASGLLGTSILAVVAILLPKPTGFSPRPLRPSSMIKDICRHLTTSALLIAFVVGGLHFFIFLNQYTFVLFLLSEAPYSLSSEMLGLIFLTYLAGTLGSAGSGRFIRQFGQPVCMATGGLILMIGSLVTLLPVVEAILLGLTINSFGFFFAHSAASSWVSQRAEQAKASASSLYLVFYYLGASTGGIYLNGFWQQGHWPGVVLGSILVLLLTIGLALSLRDRRPNVR